MVLSCIVIGIMFGIVILSFEKVNRWYSVFTTGSLSNSGAETFYVECPKCSGNMKKVKSGSQICSSCHTYF